eukprot:TRINITY_DN109796_c0_g1_i1.p1 TRINITY_DN109796_c0_g1~~TRINITY_DN109796_c0_g1_i1.p1  ORF type:complete len:464 (+),score=80.83 TRINITY_DN109796_c0_g1_i1:14-1405(+)
MASMRLFSRFAAVSSIRSARLSFGITRSQFFCLGVPPPGTRSSIGTSAQQDDSFLTRAASRERQGLDLGNEELGERRKDPMRFGTATEEALEVKEAMTKALDMRDWSGVRAAFDAMPQPEQVVYTFLLHAADRCNKRFEAEDIFAEMKNKGVFRSEIAFTSLINLCAREGDVGRVRQLMQELKSEGLTPDVMVYSAALTAFGRSGDSDGGLALWQEMISSGVQPTAISYIAFLNVSAAARDPAASRERLMEMAKFGLRPQAAHWNAVLKACKLADDANFALQILEEMKTSSVPPNIVSYTAAIGSLHAERSAGWPEKVKALRSDMESQGIQPDSFFIQESIKGQLGDFWHVSGFRAKRAALEALDYATLQGALDDLKFARGKGIRLTARTAKLEEELQEVLSSPFRGQRAANPPPLSGATVAPKAADWVEVHSQEHGRPYYWDRVSGVTQWERPAPSIPVSRL